MITSDQIKNKNVDFALVGHNFFTFLLSIDLLNSGKKVLVLDDDRFNYGDFFTNSLTSLDYYFLRAWGEHHNIEILKNIKDYLVAEKVVFFVGKKQVVLGDHPHKNFRELCRKFPHYFLLGEKEMGNFIHESKIMAFDNSFYDFCQKMSELFFLGKKSGHWSSLFFNSLSLEMQERFDYFFSQYFKEDDTLGESARELKSLTLMARGFFQGRPEITGTRFELLHLFFSLISPYFKLDHDRLIGDLLAHHIKKNGEFKKLNLSELKIQRGLMTSFELESYDGLIRPNKMVFFGVGPENYLPKLNSHHGTTYTCLNVRMKFKEKVPKILNNIKCVFSSPMKIGTHSPFWEGYFFENRAEFNLIYLKLAGNKVDFVYSNVKESLIKDLRFLFPEFSFEVVDCQMKFTLDVFVEDKNYTAHQMKFPKKLSGVAKRIFSSGPLLTSKLKNVYYFGPSKNNSLGTFSSLLLIKEWRDSL